MNESERVKQYKHDLKFALIFYFGNRCQKCNSTDELEYAHKVPNGFNGMGRGSYKRYIHIKNHLDEYILLCSDCHEEYDKPRKS